MLFSHPGIVDYLSATFECAWQSVRPVPQVSIDFGDGHRLHRTLNGNIATWFCTPDGRVLDLVAGLVDPDTFLARAEFAAGLHEILALATELDPVRRQVRRYHLTASGLTGRTAEEISELAAQARLGADLSKISVEGPLKYAMSDLLKKKAELRQRLESIHATLDADGEAPLLADTRYNETVRDPLVHALLAERALALPAELTEEVYRDILDVELSDPYLGLAPYVLGGEGGRTKQKTQPLKYRPDTLFRDTFPNPASDEMARDTK